MEIRAERLDDAGTIAALVAAAFADAPHADGTEAAIVDGLRNAGALALSLVAVTSGHIVGYVAFSPVTVEGAAGGWFGLGPVAVELAHRRRGIGAALIQAGLARLRADGAHGCVVLGDPDYYGRFGFEHDPSLHYPDAPAPFFQRIVFERPAPHGAVAYHPAFLS